MATYLIKRLLLFFPTIILVSIIIFVVMRVVPGDPALMILAGDDPDEANFTQEDLQRVRESLGIEGPLVLQYFDWIGGAVRGDLGTSFRFDGVAVTDELKDKFPVTLQLAIMAVVISVVVAVPVGIIGAVKQDQWPDYLGKIWSISGVAMPTFWVAILMVFVLARFFSWLPPLNYAQLWEDPLTNLQQMIFPALALSYHSMAAKTRITRSAMLEVLREDYIRTARAKGLGELVVLARHCLRNALLPVVTVTGLQFAVLLGGSVLVEVIFTVPGIGHLMIDSVGRRDFNVIQGVILMAAMVVLLLNLIVDLTYAWLDPRIRYA